MFRAYVICTSPKTQRVALKNMYVSMYYSIVAPTSLARGLYCNTQKRFCQVHVYSCCDRWEQYKVYASKRPPI